MIKKIKEKGPFKVKVNGGAKKLHVKDGGKDHYGTPDKIVFNFRFWDTGCGRCSTNIEYMKLVSERLVNFPAHLDELEFLTDLDKRGLIEIKKAN